MKIRDEMKYSIKPTKKQRKIMKKYAKLFDELCSRFWDDKNELEREMSLECSIPEMEFFMPNSEWYCGIGNAERTMKLIQFEEL